MKKEDKVVVTWPWPFKAQTFDLNKANGRHAYDILLAFVFGVSPK